MLTDSQFLYVINEQDKKHDKETLALLKALWFYAHKSTYCINDANPIAAIDEDVGRVARAAISEYSGMDKFTQKEVC